MPVTAAYFNKVNAEGGINGRRINFLSYDDGYSPPKTVEQTRRLVEGDEVLFIFGALGTAQNTAVQRYMNAKKVPQLFIISGANKFNDPRHFPWTIRASLRFQSQFRRLPIRHSFVVRGRARKGARGPGGQHPPRSVSSGHRVWSQGYRPLHAQPQGRPALRLSGKAAVRGRDVRLAQIRLHQQATPPNAT
jgi:hypothetical protein